MTPPPGSVTKTRLRPYRPRKPPAAEVIEYDDAAGIAVLRTDDLAVARPLAEEAAARYDIDLDGEPTVEWVRRTWCSHGGEHESDYLAEQAGALGATPAVVWRPS